MARWIRPGLLGAALFLLSAADAWGQGFAQPMPAPTRYVPARSPNQLYLGGTLIVPIGPRVNAIGYPPYGPGYGYGMTYFGYPMIPYAGGYVGGPEFSGYGAMTPIGPTPVPPPPPLLGAGGPALPAVGTGDQQAELRLDFPAPVSLTVNGKPQPGLEQSPVLQSPTLAPGEKFTFAIVARWSVGTSRYEWERTVTLSGGERSRMNIARGFPVPAAPGK